MMNTQTPLETPLDRTFAALADPTRREILARLVDGEQTVMALASGFRMSQPAVSKHLGVLERAGLITRRRDGTRRPCALSGEGLREAAAFLGPFLARWDERFTALDALLAEQGPDAHAGMGLTPEEER